MYAFRIEKVDNAAVCRVEGNADAAHGPALRECVVALAAYRNVVLDFSRVAFIDSAGLGCLIVGARRIHAADGDVVLCSARRAVHRLLHAVGTDCVLPIVKTMDEAVAVLEGSADPGVDPFATPRHDATAEAPHDVQRLNARPG